MNVILIILDTLRKDHLGVYGNQWIKTPNLDALAEESIVFTQAYPESLPTIPFRRSTHTGKRVFPFRRFRPRKGDPIRIKGWEPIPEEDVTLSEILQHNGYRTAFITDTYHQFKPAMNFHRGFSEWRWIRGQESDPYNSALPTYMNLDHFLPPSIRDSDYPKRILLQYLANTKNRENEENWFAPKVFRAGMRWLEENKNAEKLFLCIDSFDPHEPWDPPKEYIDLYDPNYEGIEVITPRYGPIDYLSDHELKHMRACYAGEVTMVDKWLGLFLEKVRELDMIDESIVVLISDHGHSLGEHGVTGKIPWVLCPELIDIPFFIRLPEREMMGKHVDSIVYNNDIHPTVLSLLNLEEPKKIDGIDLTPLILGEEKTERGYGITAFGNYVFIGDQNHAAIFRCDGSSSELYDLVEDPYMNVDIARDNPDVVEEMLAKVLSEAGGSIPVYSTKRSEKKWYEMI